MTDGNINFCYIAILQKFKIAQRTHARMVQHVRNYLDLEIMNVTVHDATMAWIVNHVSWPIASVDSEEDCWKSLNSKDALYWLMQNVEYNHFQLEKLWKIHYVQWPYHSHRTFYTKCLWTVVYLVYVNVWSFCHHRFSLK